MDRDKEKNKGGRPPSGGEKKVLVVRVESDSEYRMLLDVPPRMRVQAILEWRRHNMSYLLESDLD